MNPVIKLRQRTSASLVEIPDSPPAPWELRDVPHGTIVTELQKSAVLKRTERIVLYMPPGYETSATRYPCSTLFTEAAMCRRPGPMRGMPT